MNQQTNPTVVPFAASQPAADEQGKATSSASQPAGSPTVAAAAGTAPKRGRPSGYAPRVVDMLCASVRSLGLSDSAAAKKVGMGTTTISRWKKQFPEIAHRLNEAREEIRAHHLQIVLNHAESDTARGLRAAMWILERHFPGDYSPKMSERFAHRDFEDSQASREEYAIHDEDLQEFLAQAKAKQAAVVAENANASAADSRNSRNSSEAEVTSQGLEPQVQSEAEGPQVPSELEGPQTVREVEGPQVPSEFVRGPRPGIPADGPVSNAGCAHFESAEGGAPAANLQNYSDGASRNSRNAAEQEPVAAPVNQHQGRSPHHETGSGTSQRCQPPADGRA